MTIRRKQLGSKGEEAACQYLKKNGYRILCRNYSCSLGEIDIVAQEGEYLVFVEVRSKSSEGFGLAEESITKRKQSRLRQLAWYYLKAERKTGSDCRFDVIAVEFDLDDRVKRLEHIENAF
ncbi:YraN family protein [Pelotomaculum propionicicum]|uniref:UPF0102 protein Pmgp_01191 n=1 Tax=Pelotomaculum propionicicum TaxID=258475 RepID=A0A4Y7RSS7_9FIRM|nr:YraN family protein [Pelotomaculum propionicicum]NLI13932.1 YraN family protein [Peptococcaceae bacterium]TEB12035.1 hypothetical protein Pmgp_01191 [Pelotomaculum propionicicum]